MADKTENPIHVEDSDKERPSGSLEDNLHSELESILEVQRNRSMVDREREVNIFRSGSAPPTVEGSLSAVGAILGGGGGNGGVGVSSEEEFRSHPAYLSYYYSHDSVNPRLPPPLKSKEDWRLAQRFQAGGGADWWKENSDSSSLFSMQPTESELMDLRNAGGRNQIRQVSAVGFDRGSITSVGLGTRRKSFADILQEGSDRPTSSSNFLSRPSSRNNYSDETELFPGLHNGVDPHDLPGVQGHGSAIPHPLGPVSRSTTPELKLVGRSPGSGLPPVGSRVSQFEQKNVRALNAQSCRINELGDIEANLQGLSITNQRNRDVNNYGLPHHNLELDSDPEFLFKSGYDESLQHDFMGNPSAGNYTDLARINGFVNNISASKMSSNNMHLNFPKRTSSSADLYSQVGSLGFESLEGSSAHLQNATANFISSGGFSVNQKRNPAIDLRSDTGPDMHSPLSDPRYIQFLQRNPDYAALVTNALGDLSMGKKNQMSSPYGELEGVQKAQFENLLLAQQREQLELSLFGKSSGFNHDNYHVGSYGLGMPYQGNTSGNSALPHVGSMFPNDRISRFNSMTRSSMRRPTGSIYSDNSNNPQGRVMSSLLDEFKNNKTMSYELPDIVDHVVEFSMDQYGSRFIQQKLETAAAEEKTAIFPEIVTHAHSLMTDVFGNYVIQKFFEHGTQSQRRDLANQLTGHVLPLSLQMYGCRVIQKALEVVALDQQTQMVAELDGSIMKCVRDQNGNHVIQKCIECVPQDRIQFIISAFYGQVVILSTHPYGCRVIQRVLEHCNDSNTQQIVMNEIMQTVCTLAQDQYGNYVIQHILQHGKPHERSAIIHKLAGQIVRMSQQKFASNVVEKCLSFGSPDERQILVNEMLGLTEENEPLQAMMKDPFGNYVVQKVLETCNDESLELLLSRIKVHLNTLKRYTYGKHIVSRIEKLIATGERRIGLSSAVSSDQTQFATAR